LKAQIPPMSVVTLQVNTNKWSTTP
jgi:hypothetical protein